MCRIVILNILNLNDLKNIMIMISTTYKDESTIYKDKSTTYKDESTTYKDEIATYKDKRTLYKDKNVPYTVVKTNALHIHVNKFDQIRQFWYSIE